MNWYDCFVLAGITLYFMFVSKNWFYLMFPLTCSGAFAHLFMMLACPESPKWLI
jgi:hypothetical protein